jgi:hypothetical protein
MINKNIEQITKDDLQALIDNKVIEQKTIEYKQELPGNTDTEKKEFLADISSFANASGGDIIYGIAEDSSSGKPKSLNGINVSNIDEVKQRFENLIRTGIQPRIPSITFSAPIPISYSNLALVIRIRKSYISPHRVTLGGHDKFYSRNSSGKYPLDVGELRIAFNLSETITERIRNFRIDRLTKVIAGETPVPLYDNPKIVLHLMPVISFNPMQNYDISIITSKPSSMEPINSSGLYYRYNLDGFVTYSRERKGSSFSYTQIYRSGILEAVEGYLLRPRDNGKYIYSNYEIYLVEALTKYLSLFKLLGIETPIFCYLTLINVKNYTMYLSPERYFLNGELPPIDRDVLYLPEAIVEDYEVKAGSILKPSFDSIWNACGIERSFNYNENGEWAPRK